MVCSIDSAKMAVMARVLEAGSYSQSVAEKAGRHKLVSLYIERHLRDADEANLLDEEDMHVFDLKPLTDPLQLVCCNICKKPVKTSQYAAHAELCRSLVSTGEIFSEVEGGKGPKKARRKERKKIVPARNPVMDRSEIKDASDAAPASSNLDKRIRVTSLAVEESGCVTGADYAAKVNGGLPTSQGTDKSVRRIRSTAKRPKVITADTMQSSSRIVTAQCFSNVISCQKASTNAAAPLATKMYYSQRNNRLRAAIHHMYHGNSGVELDQCMKSMNAAVGSVAACQGSLCSTKEQLHDHSEKGYGHSLILHNSGLIASQNPETCLGGDDECQPSGHSKQYPVNDLFTSEPTPVGVMGSRYILKPHSFTVTAETSVPV